MLRPPMVDCDPHWQRATRNFPSRRLLSLEKPKRRLLAAHARPVRLEQYVQQPEGDAELWIRGDHDAGPREFGVKGSATVIVTAVLRHERLDCLDDVWRASQTTRQQDDVQVLIELMGTMCLVLLALPVLPVLPVLCRVLCLVLRVVQSAQRSFDLHYLDFVV